MLEFQAPKFEGVSRMNLLVTGANGFLGRAILRNAAGNWDGQLFGSVRLDSQFINPAANRLVVCELSDRTEWSHWLKGIDVVVHTAARAHVLRDHSDNPLLDFRHVNRDATLKLARECAWAGVRRFVFISSIGVNGTETFGTPFSASDTPQPVTPYAVSKMEAEEGLWRVAAETGLEVVVIRPPLVYGAGAPGNFSQLLRWLNAGIPLPLAAVNNKRSLVGIDNLVDLIMTCLHHPAASGKTFLVCDEMDVSIPELLRLIGDAIGKPARLFPVPTAVLRTAASLFGMGDTASRLLGSLQVNIAKTKSLLGWKPKVELIEGLRQIVKP